MKDTARSRLRTLGLVATAVVMMGGGPFVAPAGAAAPAIGIASSVEQVRPTATAAGRPTSASLVAARNEFESFQIVVQGPATGVTVTGDLFGWGTTTLYRVDYYDVAQASDAEGGLDRWGDILVPERDVVYGEDRSAFPFDVPSGENRVVWVDVFVPPGTPAGNYGGNLTVASADGSVNVPVALEILAMDDLPSTSTLKNAFFMTYNSGTEDMICAAHTGSDTCNGDAAQRRNLHSLYSRVALENRVTISNGFALRYNQSASAHPAADWETTFEAPLIRGTSVVPPGARFRLSGAQDSVVTAYAYTPDHCLQACADQWEVEANEAGQAFADRMMWYGCDEAGTNAVKWQNCDNTLTDTMAGWARPAFATSSIDNYNDYAAPTGIPISTLVTLIQQMGDRRPAYNDFLSQPGRALWLYSSCTSHGCGAGDTLDAYFNGWPGYAIDAPANQHRAMSWLVERYDASGELYWSAMHRLTGGWARGGLMWDGANGDGTLFYPGRVDRIGGTRDIPLESVRLKRIRDGREDWEYMRWLDRNGGAADVDRVVNTMYPTANSATVAKDGTGAGSLLAGRAQLIDLIRAKTVRPSSARPGRIAFSSNRDGDFEIFTMDPDGTDVSQLTTDPAADKFPAWSPDGTRMAWTRGPDVWVMNGDGSGATNLTATVDGAASKPAWSPNGSTIVYVYDDPIGSSPLTDIYKMAADGSGKTPLVTYASGGISSYDPAVSPGDVVFFTQDGGGGGQAPGLFRINLTGGGGFARVTSNIDEVVDVSGDGSRLTFSRSATGASPYDVFLSNPDGSSLSNLTATAAGGATVSDFQSTFAPAGDRVAFVSAVGGDLEIWTMATDGTGAAAITANASVDADPDWAPPAASELVIGDVILREGQSGYRTAYFAVTLNAPNSVPVSVKYATANSTATQPGDYWPRTGTISFPAGAVSRYAAVSIKGDTADEVNEQVRVNLSSSTNAIIVDGVGLGTIIDDDPFPGGLRLTAGDATIDEGDGGSRIARITVSLSSPASTTVTVRYATSNLSAVQPGDYAARSGTLTFNPGVTTQVVALTVKADAVVEGAEQFKVTLSGATGGSTISDATGVVTIRNDD